MINWVFIHRAFLPTWEETYLWTDYTGRGRTVESVGRLIPCRGGVSGFSNYPAVQLRKYRPTPSFTPRQTLMP
jgi:hypothetical protein